MTPTGGLGSVRDITVTTTDSTMSPLLVHPASVTMRRTLREISAKIPSSEAALEQFIIEGGRPLRGTVRPSGNKNAALPLLAACLLTDQPILLRNVPDIRDVQ